MSLSKLASNGTIIVLLTFASLTSGYRVWHTGLHRAGYLASSRLRANAELPRTVGFRYGDGAWGTYVLALSSSGTVTEADLAFYKDLTAANELLAKGTKLIIVYPRADRKGDQFLQGHGLGHVESVAADNVTHTPALYLVDNHGAVRGIWEGPISVAERTRILQAF